MPLVHCDETALQVLKEPDKRHLELLHVGARGRSTQTLGGGRYRDDARLQDPQYWIAYFPEWMGRNICNQGVGVSNPSAGTNILDFSAGYRNRPVSLRERLGRSSEDLSGA